LRRRVPDVDRTAPNEHIHLQPIKLRRVATETGAQGTGIGGRSTDESCGSACGWGAACGWTACG